MKIDKKSLTNAVSSVRANSLHANSMYIMIAQGIVAGFGYLFWIIAAHFYTSEMVGLAGSLIAVTTLITNISLLGFNNALVRFIPQAKNKNDVINTSLLVVLVASLASAAIYLIGLKFFSPKLLFVTHQPLLLVMFLTSIVLVAINALTDSVFLANRATKYNVIIYTAYSVLRVAAPLALITFGVMGIFAAHMLGIVAAIILSFYYMYRKLAWRPSLRLHVPELRRIAGYSLANYAAGFLWSAPLLIAPLMIVNTLGASSAAYFYMVMMIINMLLIIPTAVTQSLFAEGSHASAEQLMGLVKKSLRVGCGLTLLATLGILLFGKLVIGTFGQEYVNGGSGLLFVMAVSGLLVAINMVGNVVLKVKKRIGTLIQINILGALSTVLLFPIMAAHGLIGIGYAYLIGQALMAIVYGGIAALDLLKQRKTQAVGTATAPARFPSSS